MWWECSECGGFVERNRRPVQCRECGTAGVIFVPAEVGDVTTGQPEGEEMRAAWLQFGLDQARLAAELP
jgi:hypothetical protein